MEIILVRHGESEGNTKLVDPQQSGDFNLNLTTLGNQQAINRGKLIGADFIRNALIYNSPYHRTRETLQGILVGAGIPNEPSLPIYEDPRLREVEHGFHGTREDIDEQQKLRDTHGYFYYRYKGGESPADCFDRVATFLESMRRQMERKNKDKVLIVTHGLTIRCFVMRFLHLSIEQFETIRNPDNCDQIRITYKKHINPDALKFSTGKWGAEGLCLRSINRI